MNFLSRLRQNLLRLPIYSRITIGNAVVIAIGAIGGTLLTRHLAGKAADLWLIILFTFIGTTLSVFINSRIIRTALRPLRELCRLVDRMEAGQAEVEPSLQRDTDPNISLLASTLQSLVIQLEERNRQLRALSQRAINAQEEERKRIARSLHDDTGQSLSTLIFNLERVEERLPAGQPDLRAKISTTRELASQALTELRKIVYDLRPTILDDLGLIPAIRWYARAHLEELGIGVQIEAPAEFPPLSPQVTTTLFRIAQEAINNIVRHSEATAAIIRLDAVDGNIRLQVEDNGRGFDVARIAGQALRFQQLGLLGIKERVELVNGEVFVDSAPARGTRLSVTLPLSPPEEV